MSISAIFTSGFLPNRQGLHEILLKHTHPHLIQRDHFGSILLYHIHFYIFVGALVCPKPLSMKKP